MDWRQFRGTGREIFLDGETVKTLHRLLNIKLMYGYSFDNFFGLMQRVAEEKSLMKLENEKFDEYVPLAIVKVRSCLPRPSPLPSRKCRAPDPLRLLVFRS